MAEKLIIAAPGKIAYRHVDIPEPGPGQVRLRTLLSGISHGTEMTSYLGRSPFIASTITPERIFVPKPEGASSFYPFEWAGYDLYAEVTAAGREVKTFRVGDKVYVPRPHQTEYVIDETDSEVLKLKSDTPGEDAVMIMLATVALTGIHDAEIKLGDVVVVFGGGVVGQLTAQMAFLSGASRVFLVEPNPERRKMAQALCPVEALDGVSEIPAVAVQRLLGGRYPDAVLECSGNIKGLKAAVQAAGVAGAVTAVGFYAGGSPDFSFGEEFLHNRVTIRASMGAWGCPSRWPDRWNRRRTLETCRDFIESRKLRFDGFISLRVPFREAQCAYETIRENPGHMRVVLTYGAT
jgi:2-desacetyl-2-hydroxyethyl bacteriochlorophyllide A dehydrogenase